MRRDGPPSGPCAARHRTDTSRAVGHCRAPAALSCRCPSPGAENRGRGYRTIKSHKIPAAHTRGSLGHRGRQRARRERSPGAPRSRDRAPCDWGPGVRRSQPLAPYEPPRTAGREWTCQELPLTILLICSVYKNTSKMFGWREEGNKWYAPRCPCGGSGKIAFVFPSGVCCPRSSTSCWRCARRGASPLRALPGLPNYLARLLLLSVCVKRAGH
jgi:hypothetical protein